MKIDQLLFSPILAFSLLLAIGFAPAHAARPVPGVEQWDVFEVELEGPKDGNPFADVTLGATFTNGTRAVEVAGFYDGEGIYRIRFMPDAPGRWRYETISNRWPLTGKRGAFDVRPAGSGNHGPVRVAHTYHFAYADGTPFRQVGTTVYNWFEAPVAQQEQTLRTLAASPFNKLRMLALPRDRPRNDPPELFPFAGEAPRAWDYARFDPAYFSRLEKRVGELRDIGVEVDLIFFHPYGRMWGFDSMGAATDERYVRYLVARLAAYRNVWWSLANEHDYIRTKSEPEWDRIFQVVQEADPYAHLRSIHNGTDIYNHTHPWVTHVSLQNGSAVEDPGRAVVYRDVYRKPIVFDEVKYEGNATARWGQLDGREMTHRFWCGTVAGTYVGHGECYTDAPGGAFLSRGGTLVGESPERLAFLRRIMEEGPAAGINPIDKWQDERMGGQPGEYYLVYFGKAAPASWDFQLYRDGVEDGQTYQVEVVDTWETTIHAVDGMFTTRRKDRYHFVDKDGRSVSLPSKPYMALRIRRVPE